MSISCVASGRLAHPPKASRQHAANAMAAFLRTVKDTFINNPFSIYSESIRINKARMFPGVAVAENLRR
jgi:hypothetical protein